MDYLHWQRAHLVGLSLGGAHPATWHRVCEFTAAGPACVALPLSIDWGFGGDLSALARGVPAVLDIYPSMCKLKFHHKISRVCDVSGAGFVACKVAAVAPERVASLTLLATTRDGWHTAASLACTPWLAAKVGI